jgi:hypothetical protein
MCYCLFLSPTLWTFTVSNDLRACSSALFVMAERTPVVKKYRDALENVIGATMEFLARAPQPNSAEETTSGGTPAQVLSSAAQTPQHKVRDLSGLPPLSPAFSGAAQESYVRGSPKMTSGSTGDGDGLSMLLGDTDNDLFGYLPQTQPSPGAEGRREGRHGEMGQMDAEWMLSLCEGDGFSLQMLNEMMRFEPTLGA